MPTEQASSPPTLRVHRLRIPTLRLNWGFAITTVGLAAILFAISSVGILIVFRAITGGSASPPTWIIVVACVLGLIPACTFAIYEEGRRWRRLLEPTRLRDDRLERIMPTPESHQRFPHRAMECTLRRKASVLIAQSRQFKKLKPGMVIAIESAAQEPAHQREILNIPFEPVDVREDSERVAWLLQTARGTESVEVPESSGRGVRKLLRGRYGWVAGTAYALFCGNMVVDLIRQRQFALLGIMVVAVGFSALYALAVDRRWWLVPGGLVMREDRAWRRRMTVRFFTPETTPLMVDLRSGWGYVLDEGRVRTFSCGEYARWLVLAGWISRARRPTEEEIRSFIGAM